MGNRGVIAFKREGVPKEFSPAIYLHWNGGRDSVEAYLKFVNKSAIRTHDFSYMFARLVQVIGNAQGGVLSVGVAMYKDLDVKNWDNGTYWVDINENDELEIVEREYAPPKEQCVYPIEEHIAYISARQPYSFDKEE